MSKNQPSPISPPSQPHPGYLHHLLKPFDALLHPCPASWHTTQSFPREKLSGYSRLCQRKCLIPLRPSQKEKGSTTSKDHYSSRTLRCTSLGEVRSPGHSGPGGECYQAHKVNTCGFLSNPGSLIFPSRTCFCPPVPASTKGQEVLAGLRQCLNRRLASWELLTPLAGLRACQEQSRILTMRSTGVRLSTLGSQGALLKDGHLFSLGAPQTAACNH